MHEVSRIHERGFSNEVAIIETKGLGLAQDLNANSDTVGHVMFCQGKSDANKTTNDDDNESVSTAVKVRQFMLQKVIMPFVNDLRDGDSKCVHDPLHDAISDRAHVALKLDSDMPFLSLLKRN